MTDIDESGMKWIIMKTTLQCVHITVNEIWKSGALFVLYFISKSGTFKNNHE